MTVTPDPTTLPAVADRADAVATALRRLATGDGPRRPAIWSTSLPRSPR